MAAGDCERAAIIGMRIALEFLGQKCQNVLEMIRRGKRFRLAPLHLICNSFFFRN